MGYFSQLAAEMDQAGIDWQNLETEPRASKIVPKKKKLKNPCKQCFTSEATKGSHCFWCYCDPRHNWNW